jgi:cell wall-associated NlpC family hydrolase
MRSYIVFSLFIILLGYTHVYTTPSLFNETKESTSTLQRVSHKKPIESLINLAKSKLGAPYEESGSGPDRFDCSGYTYYLFKEYNVTLPRTSLAQSTIGDRLNREALQPGDLLFFDTSEKGQVNHTGLYLGEGKFIHASSGKAYSVTISHLDGWYKNKFLWGIRKHF